MEVCSNRTMRFLYTYPSEMNQSGGLEVVLKYISNNIPLFPNFLLFSIFLIISIGGYTIENKKRDNANILLWFSIAGYITTIIAMILFLTGDFIGLYTVVFTLSISILATMTYFLADALLG